MKTIVIIGDWFIDENWIVARDENYSSSHTGDQHYFIKHKDLSKRMVNLCGASEVLEVLRPHFKKEEYKLIGYGAWNKMDDDILQCMICEECGANAGKMDQYKYKYTTPFTVKGLLNVECSSKEKGSIRTCPYEGHVCNYNPHLVNLAKEDKNISTNRIIRIYEGYGSGTPHLLSRTDFQFKISEEDLEHSLFNEDPIDGKSLEGNNVIAVVIEDHGKGVISPLTIRKLIEALGNVKNIRWYIRSKVNNPEWMNVLHDELHKKNCMVRLKIIDHQLAVHKKGQRRWQYGEKELGRASIEILGEMTGDTVWKGGKECVEDYRKAERAAIIFDDNMVIAKENNDCYTLFNPPGPEQLINIGKTTMFFNALIAQDLSKEYEDKDFGTQCYKALRCAYEWTKYSTSAWSKEEPYFYGKYETALDKKILMEKGFENKYKKENYLKIWKRWNDSSKDLGIVSKDVPGDIDRLEIWRGEGVIEQYICVGGDKRDRITRLVSSISKFKAQKKPKYPFNCLFVANPGWGKSYLANCIAKHFDMYYLEFSISQMTNSKDLVDCFDLICSVQNREQKQVLIFMDEINCKIEGNSALGLLLSPIWEGTFVKGGKTYKLCLLSKICG